MYRQIVLNSIYDKESLTLTGAVGQIERYTVYIYIDNVYIHIYICHTQLRYGNETYFSNLVNSRNLEHIFACYDIDRRKHKLLLHIFSELQQ